MSTITRENKFSHCKTYFQRSFTRKHTWITSKEGLQVRTSNQSLRTPNKVILEYANLQEQQSFYVNYANTIYKELPSKIKNVINIQQQLVGAPSMSEQELSLIYICIYIYTYIHIYTSNNVNNIINNNNNNNNNRQDNNNKICSKLCSAYVFSSMQVSEYLCICPVIAVR